MSETKERDFPYRLYGIIIERPPEKYKFLFGFPG
jgi:hypothetical protein